MHAWGNTSGSYPQVIRPSLKLNTRSVLILDRSCAKLCLPWPWYEANSVFFPERLICCTCLHIMVIHIIIVLMVCAKNSVNYPCFQLSIVLY